MKTQFKILAYVLYVFTSGLVITTYVRKGWTMDAHVDAAGAVMAFTIGILFHILSRTLGK